MAVRTTLATALALMLGAAVTPAAAQRASLADRVATLEQRAANPQQTLDLLNQVTQLRGELQALRGQLEEMQQANEQLRMSMRNQYLDVDGRITRSEEHTSELQSHHDLVCRLLLEKKKKIKKKQRM